MANSYQKAGAEEQTYRIFMNSFGKVKITTVSMPDIVRVFLLTHGDAADDDDDDLSDVLSDPNISNNGGLCGSQVFQNSVCSIFPCWLSSSENCNGSCVAKMNEPPASCFCNRINEYLISHAGNMFGERRYNRQTPLQSICARFI